MSWEEDRAKVFQMLDDLRDEQRANRTRMEEEFTDMTVQIEKLRWRSSVWGAITGALTGLMLSIVSCGCGASLSPEYGEQPDQVEAVLQSTVIIYDEYGDIICSGFSVENRLATAAHCVSDGAPFYVSTFASPQFEAARPGEVTSLSEQQDIAMIRADVSPPTLRLAEENPVLQDPLWVCGHPFGLAYSVNEGRFVALRHTFDRDWYQVDITVAPGNSGGPLVNEAGELLGVTSFRLDVLAGFVPLNTVRAALAGNYRVEGGGL